MLPALAPLFVDAVASNTGLGFVPPISEERSREYWLSIRRDLEAGTRLLFVASVGEQIVGSGQLSFPTTPSAAHRADLQKLFVDSALRERGIGRALMLALHDAARAHGRSLILLSTRAGRQGHRLYLSLGYKEVGVVPGYALMPAGERGDAMFLYCDLASPPQDDN